MLAEQEHLDAAHTALSDMRRRAEGLLDDVRQAGNPDLDYQAALVHRVAVLGESNRPLLFGRIDGQHGESWHIGRRHVEDLRGDPVVVDWRAPISVPFYRARSGDAHGLKRRRQVMVDRKTVVAVADDLFGTSDTDLAGTRLRGGDALLAELERARTGEMLDIVATIQAEQDEIIRAPLDLLVAVQGGPGTGKTAVGLHRAAYLALQLPGPVPVRCAGDRAQSRLPALHRPGAPGPGGGGRDPDHHLGPGPSSQDPGRRHARGRPAEGRPPDGPGVGPGPRASASAGGGGGGPPGPLSQLRARRPRS